ncbi:MAG TPA: AmmeMemoRadiSam system protein B [Bacteroidales bacterium]|nr:AmmeMemoRadiSam system protein B [Bacteroidales bacterium]
MNYSPESGGKVRQPVAAGRFYSELKDTLYEDVKNLFEESKKTGESNDDVRAIIVPHAGYVFSGKIAAAAFSTISKKHAYRNIFIIGSSHVMSFDGASVYSSGDFITPLGKVKVNSNIAEKLKNNNQVFNHPETPHVNEHSIEVQLPLIQYYFEELPPIVPIVIGTTDKQKIKEIAESLRDWFTSENLFVISSDFSHYPSYKDAIEADSNTADGIITGNPELFLKAIEQNSGKRYNGLVTSMCGWTSGLMLLYLTNKNKSTAYNIIDYNNSGDSMYGSKNEVVGYYAISITERVNYTGFISFSEEEKKEIFSIARNSIESRLGIKNETTGRIKHSPKLSEKMGAFVTLRINGLLRGCIGRFVSTEPLYEVVRSSAKSSAFDDPRFSPLTKKEYEKTEMEITVLGPLKRVFDIEEIILGKHGIYIKKDMHSGTMLPQVATENGWTLEQFLGYTARDKTGIGWEGWKSAELYIYEGIVLEENKD